MIEEESDPRIFSMFNEFLRRTKMVKAYTLANISERRVDFYGKILNENRNQ